jgi:hypothetical protein|tara:strand:- start:122 stop:589 length:468 start_codon:yes stop_codon:yes gene_type:complete
MKKTILYFILFFLISEDVFSQFRHNTPVQSLPTNLNGELDNTSSIFNPNRININHSFSMSMHNINNQNTSVAGYTNNISYLLNENLIFNSNITLYKQNSPYSSKNPGSLNQFNIGYDLGLKFRASKNSFLELKVQSFPYFQNYNQNSFLNNQLFD